MHSSNFSVKEFMQFTSQILVERTRPNERASVKEQGNIIRLGNFLQPGLMCTSLKDYMQV